MDLLSGLTTEDETIKEDQGDSLGGFQLMETGVYDFKIEHAYVTQSASKATAINLNLIGSTGSLRTTIYITGGEAKGCKNYYEKKNKTTGKMEKHYLPGFNQINGLCLMTAGKSIKDLAPTVEKKIINIYSYDEKKEMPTEVDMLMGIVGKNITAAVFKQIDDKKKKDAATGKYVPTGETREANEIDKFFRTSDQLTFNEIQKQVTEPAFKTAWLEKWKGKVKDNTDKRPAATGAVSGTPTAPAAPTPLFSNQA